MKVLILEPYFTGSHAAWAESLASHSSHETSVSSLSGRFWKWRMYGGAVALARKYMESKDRPDLLLATDMLDLSTFLAMTRKVTSEIPCAIYFHENQLTYPWSPDDRDLLQKRDRHYGFTNYVSALAADTVFFNSEYHMRSFLDELGPFLKQFPDYNEFENVEIIRKKSSVLPLGIDLKRLDIHTAERRSAAEQAEQDPTDRARPPLILWNHRWEYDKNPADFFQALYLLSDRGLDFEVAVLGENFRNQPEEFLIAREKLGEKIKQFGAVSDLESYASWLWKADIVPITSNQDFFGGSLVEALYCDCYPVLPRRLAYPELIPRERHAELFYDDFEGLVDMLERAISNIEAVRERSLRAQIDQFDWTRMIPRYDKVFSAIVGESGANPTPA